MLKKILIELFSSDAAQPETHTASASLSADTIRDLECRKRAIVADITRLAEELAACSSLGAPVGGLANPATAASNTTSATATFSLRDGYTVHAAESLGRAEPYTGDDAIARIDLASANLVTTDSVGGPYACPATFAEAAGYSTRK